MSIAPSAPILGFILLSVSFALPGSAARATSVLATESPALSKVLASEERQLWEVFEALEDGERERALALVETLAAQRADFALLQAVHEDLRAAGTPAEMGRVRERWLSPRVRASAVEGEQAPAEVAGLALRQESAQRWRHRTYELPTQLPFVLGLDQDVRHLIVVETDTSRLFLFRNTAEGLRLVRDYYASIGRRGAGKEMEGDERTPLGVYFTLSRMDEEGLAERYGAHAFPLDYPNAWDRRLERTGRGIWIHGVPPQTYSRPPLDSDGCVALTNPDIQWLAKRLAPRRTPVVITDRVPWDTLSPALSPRERQRLRTRIDDWLSAWAAADPDLEHFYEAPLMPTHLAPAGAAATLGAQRMTLIQDPNQPQVVVASFGDGAGGWYRQHWRQDDAQGVWRIAAERLRPPRR